MLALPMGGRADGPPRGARGGARGCASSGSRRSHGRPPRSLLRLVFATVAAVLLSRPGATRADVSLVSFDTADLPLRFVGAAEHYLKVNDACGVCGGDSKTCMGCDGVPNSLYRYDACGVCGDPASDAFNADCLDCAGVLHGASAVDDCGVCRDPADAAFSRAGVPDSHLGGCVGCDGIPNSGNELDACGVCAGLGCEPDDPTKRSWCCDCAETAFGTHVVDFCCACVDRASHWHALSGGAAEGPPAAHALAENLWRQGRDALAEQSAAAAAFRDARDESRARGVADGTVQPGDLTYARSFSLFELGERARAAFVEGWDIMRDFSKSDDMSRCYAETYVFGNRTNPRDACGVCGGDNATCAGCAGGVSVPDGGPVLDDCASCGANQGNIDRCDVCFGDNQTCVGCDGVPGSGATFDGCLGSTDPRYLNFRGRAGEPGSGCSDPEAFRAACDAGEGGCCGCDGVPNSGATRDGCGECQVWDDPALDKEVNYTCSGCDGVPFSTSRHDWCCDCDGEADAASACYADAAVFGSFATTPFDPYTEDYDQYFNDIGKARYDECGECAALKKNGSTCLGCDGVHGSGLVFDACGVCGGDCSTCNATQTGLPYDCEPPGLGWTKMDRTCSFHRTVGHHGGVDEDDPWVLWPAFPNGTALADGVSKTPRNQTWYRRLNRADALPFLDAAKGECRMYLEPPPPPTARERREWIVSMFGREEGPFTLVELETGFVEVADGTTGIMFEAPLLPTTLVARVVTAPQTQTIAYGATSRYQARADEWNARNGARFASAATRAETANLVTVDGFATTLARWDALADGSYVPADADGDGATAATDTTDTTSASVSASTAGSSLAFIPLAAMPGMERVAYPYCTGSTWRGGRHRLHGKKLPGNFLGVITTENITDAGNGLVDQAWNPLDEYIYDVSNGWMDQKCQCSWEWEYQSEPIPPTCPRVWFPWSGWVDDGWFVGNNVYFADDARYAVDAARSLSGGGWRVSGGWWVQDYGGGGPRQYADSGANIYNAYGAPGDFGFGAVRGPVRVDAAGTFSVVTTAPRREDRPVDLKPYVTDETFAAATAARCYGAARVAPPRRNSAGAIWHEARQPTRDAAWETTFAFVLREPSERCVDVAAVSRGFGAEVRTHLHGTCEVKGGDGFAFVVWDADADEEAALDAANATAPDDAIGVGAPGPGLGYAGLRRSVAVEFDLWHNPLLEEPYEPHVAIHTDGASPNSAHHGARLASTTEIPDFADGSRHVARVTFAPDAGWDAVASAIASGECQGAGARLGRFMRANPGLLRVYIDDMDAPVLSAPIEMATVFRDGADSARVGFTAGTGESWVTVDVVAWNFTSYA